MVILSGSGSAPLHALLIAIYLSKALTTLPSYLPIYLAKACTTLPILHNVHSKALTTLANIHQCIKIE